MTTSVELTVNDKSLTADPHQSLLTTLLVTGFTIPHLCYHPALPPQGRCSLCLVEIREGEQWRVEHACLLKVQQGMIIRTHSETLGRARYLAASLLSRRGPFRKQTAQQLLTSITGAPPAGELSQPNHIAGCILCGLCISMCRKIGHKRLTFLGRGPELAVGYVSEQSSCNSCHACATVCPTNFIDNDGATTFKKTLYNKQGDKDRPTPSSD